MFYYVSIFALPMMFVVVRKDVRVSLHRWFSSLTRQRQRKRRQSAGGANNDNDNEIGSNDLEHDDDFRGNMSPCVLKAYKSNKGNAYVI